MYMKVNNYQEKNRLDEIKSLLKTGQISYAEAKELSEKPLKDLNQRIVKLSKEFGRTPRLITFISFMR